MKISNDIYKNLSSKERIKAAVAAIKRGDNKEVKLLMDTAPDDKNDSLTSVNLNIVHPIEHCPKCGFEREKLV